MDDPIIRDEQDLLERYYKAECSVIWDRSSQISSDMEELKRIILEYARSRKLNSQFLYA